MAFGTRIKTLGGTKSSISLDELIDGSANVKTVRDNKSIQSVIDSITDASESNLYVVMVPPGHESETFTEASNIYVQFNTDSWGKTLDLSSTTTFTRSDGSTFMVNCTVDAEFNPTGGVFSTGFDISVINTGTATISFDSTYAILPGQRAWFTWDGTQFVGGV